MKNPNEIKTQRDPTGGIKEFLRFPVTKNNQQLSPFVNGNDKNMIWRGRRRT